MFVVLLVFSLVCSVGLATAYKAACINAFFELQSPEQGSRASSEHIWRYKETIKDRKWQIIGFSSKKNSSLWPIILAKFKDKTDVFPNGSLTISSFVPELSGIYYCQSKTEGKLRHNIIIVVAVECEKTVCEGDDAILECDILKYKHLLPVLQQPIELEWKYGDKTKTKLVTMGPDMNVTYQNPDYPISAIQGRGALRIGSENKGINGQQYTCVVHGGNGATKRQSSVVINLKKCQKKIKSCVGEKKDLQCPYYQPLATYTEDTRLEWYNGSTKIGTVVGNQSPKILRLSSSVKINGFNGKLTLLSSGFFDTGQYRCKVLRGTVLLAEHSVTLNVTQCINATSIPNPNKKVQSAKKTYTSPFLWLLALFLVPVLIICLYFAQKLRRNDIFLCYGPSVCWSAICTLNNRIHITAIQPSMADDVIAKV